MSRITVSHLTKDYGHGRGVFDLGISVNQGQCCGFLGPNGAGKTTTIRHLMGFSKPQSGSTATAAPSRRSSMAKRQKAEEDTKIQMWTCNVKIILI